MAISTCSGCGLVFSSTSSFDKHRTGGYGGPIYEQGTKGKIIGRSKPDRRCLTPAEMEAKGMVFSTERERWSGAPGDFSWGQAKEEED